MSFSILAVSMRDLKCLRSANKAVCVFFFFLSKVHMDLVWPAGKVGCSRVCKWVIRPVINYPEGLGCRGPPFLSSIPTVFTAHLKVLWARPAVLSWAELASGRTA